MSLYSASQVKETSELDRVKSAAWIPILTKSNRLLNWVILS